MQSANTVSHLCLTLNSYRLYVLVLTFICYAAYHMSRKPFSVVAVSIHKQHYRRERKKKRLVLHCCLNEVSLLMNKVSTINVMLSLIKKTFLYTFLYIYRHSYNIPFNRCNLTNDAHLYIYYADRKKQMKRLHL